MEIGKKIKCKKLFDLLNEKFEWLFSKYDFKIIGFEYSPTLGGEGAVKLENAILRIELINDRDKAYFEFSPREGWKLNETVTFDLIHQLISNEICNETYINIAQIEFLKKNFDEIISLFSITESENTLKKVRILKKERAKRLFT